MKKHDARKLDHATLEALRERAVQRVQEGESPEVVARALVQTLGSMQRNAREHYAVHAARTAFQISGAPLSLMQSFPSLN